jgi:predicted dehydrogenase
MTRTFEEAKAVWETVEKEKRVMQVGSQTASEDFNWQVRKTITAGLLGPLLSATASAARNSTDGEWNYKIEPEAGPDQEGDNHIDWTQWLGSTPKVPYNPEYFFRFRKFWDYSGGIATDLFYHRMTGLTTGWGGGLFPWRVSSLGDIVVFKDRQVPETTSMLIDYPTGLHVVLYGCMASTSGLETGWHGHEASIMRGRLTPQDLFADGFRQRVEAAGLQGQWTETSTRRGGNREVVLSEFRFEEQPRQTHMENFLNCVKSREKPTLDALTGFQIMTAIAMGVESFRTGKTMYLDEKTLKVTDKPIQRNHLIG